MDVVAEVRRKEALLKTGALQDAIFNSANIRKDGSRFPAIVSVTALRDDRDGIIGYLPIGTDNTARKRVEAEQQKLDQRLRDQQFYTRSLIEERRPAEKSDPSRGRGTRAGDLDDRGALRDCGGGVGGRRGLSHAAPPPGTPASSTPGRDETLGRARGDRGQPDQHRPRARHTARHLTRTVSPIHNN